MDGFESYLCSELTTIGRRLIFSNSAWRRRILVLLRESTGGQVLCALMTVCSARIQDSDTS